MSDRGKTLSTTFSHKTEMHMGGGEGWSFITIQILRHYNWNVSPATGTKKTLNNSQHKDDDSEIGEL